MYLRAHHCQPAFVFVGSCPKPRVGKGEEGARRREETAAHLRSSMRTVSMVFSRFHWARQGSCLGSTTPFCALTQGRLTWLTNWMVGGSSGYFFPQCILTL